MVLVFRANFVLHW